LAFKTEGQANTPTAVLKEARVLVSDVYEHFMWETDDTLYKRVDGVTKSQQGKIELCTCKTAVCNCLTLLVYPLLLKISYGNFFLP
jgi:hypothetical protein